MRSACVSAMFVFCAALVYADEAKTGGVKPEEAKEGFVSLFDGKTLDGWQGDVKNYAVEDGVMVCHGEYLFTKKEYANFILRFEFKTPPRGNNGVGIRAPLEGNPSYNGMEIQILDDGDPVYKDIEPYQAHGSIYGVVPAKRGFLKPAGQWNQEEIQADGPHIKVTLNGTRDHRGRLEQDRQNPRPPRSSGHTQGQRPYRVARAREGPRGVPQRPR